MSTARLVVCEKRGIWGAALRRLLADAPIRLVETRSLDECWGELQRGGFLTLETTPETVETIARFLQRTEKRHPQARAVCVGQTDLRCGEYLLRAAGAIDVLYSPRQLGAVARMVRRHFAGLPADGSVRADVWARLPWND